MDAILVVQYDLRLAMVYFDFLVVDLTLGVIKWALDDSICC